MPASLYAAAAFLFGVFCFISYAVVRKLKLHPLTARALVVLGCLGCGAALLFGVFVFLHIG
jgi:hypothetical protein